MVVLAGEGVSLAICKVLPIRFSSMKVIFDVTLVLIACVLGFGFTGSLQGVREGTIAAAVLVGMLVRAISKRKDALQRRFRKNLSFGENFPQ